MYLEVSNFHSLDMMQHSHIHREGVTVIYRNSFWIFMEDLNVKGGKISGMTLPEE